MSRKPVWRIAPDPDDQTGGGQPLTDDTDPAPDTDQETDGEGEDDLGDADEDDDDPDEAAALGDKGKQALERMKAKWRAERKAHQDTKAKLTKATTPDPVATATDALNQRLLRSEVKAAAKGKLADPLDALKLLDLTQFAIDDTGAVDEDEIADAIDDLIKSKPYLAAQGVRRFQGSADGGARKDSRPKQLTRADLDAMTPEQIEKAHKNGQLADLLR